jgi:nitrogen fixation-related uncharacterized protein
MSKGMQLANDLGTPALVGLLGLYTALAQALDDAAPPDLWERIMGPNGVMVLVVIIAALLYAANKKQREQLEKATDSRLEDMQKRLEQVTKERNEYLAELLEEREANAGARPARRRPA